MSVSSNFYSKKITGFFFVQMHRFEKNSKNRKRVMKSGTKMGRCRAKHW